MFPSNNQHKHTKLLVFNTSIVNSSPINKKKTVNNTADARHQWKREDVLADFVHSFVAEPAQVCHVVVQQRHSCSRHRGVCARQKKKNEEEVRRTSEALVCF